MTVGEMDRAVKTYLSGAYSQLEFFYGVVCRTSPQEAVKVFAMIPVPDIDAFCDWIEAYDATQRGRYVINAAQEFHPAASTMSAFRAEVLRHRGASR